MNVLVLDHEPYHPRKKDLYHIDYLQSKGINIEYWSLLNVVNEFYKIDNPYSYKEEAEFVTYIKNFKTLKTKLSAIPSDTIIILEFPFNNTTLKLHQFLFGRFSNIIRVDYYNKCNNAMADDPIGQSVNVLDKLKFVLTNQKMIFDRIISKLKSEQDFNHKYLPKLYFTTGKINEIDHNKGKNLISLNSFDFENVKYNPAPIESIVGEERYAVFLDIYITNHPDFRLSTNTAHFDPNVYFKFLNDFFTYIENKYQLKVVIAAHPKANYTNEFGDRLVLKNKTKELVKDCSLVLSHGSLSINFATLYKKPIIYFYNDQFEQNDVGRIFIARMKKADQVLNTTTIKFDENFKDIDCNLVVDEAKYDAYNHTYLIAEANDLSNKEIFYNELLKLKHA